MEIKFIKFLKTTGQLFLSVNGESVGFTVNYSNDVPYLKPTAGSREGVGIGTEYLMKKISPAIFNPAEAGTKFAPLGIGIFKRLIGMKGQMNSAHWRAAVDFDVNGPRMYRAPSPAVAYAHYVHKGTVLDNDKHFVTIVTCRHFLLLTDGGDVYCRTNVDVPASDDIINYVNNANAYLNHIRDEKKGISDRVSAEAVNISVDMNTGNVDFLSGGSRSQSNDIANEARAEAREICDYFGLTVSKALADGEVADQATGEEITLERLFELGDGIRDYLPGEAIRCEEALKFGNYYYLLHGMELSAGEQDGILVRLETVRYGSSKSGVTYSSGSPVAVLFDHYAITRSVGPLMSITDFTGMADKEFTKYLRSRCR